MPLTRWAPTIVINGVIWAPINGLTNGVLHGFTGFFHPPTWNSGVMGPRLKTGGGLYEICKFHTHGFHRYFCSPLLNGVMGTLLTVIGKNI